MAGKSDRGNSKGDARELVEQMVKQAYPLMRFEATRERLEESGLYLTGLRLRLPDVYGGESLLVMSGHQEGIYQVGFHAGGSLLEVLSIGLRRLESGDIKWKPDSYKNS